MVNIHLAAEAAVIKRLVLVLFAIALLPAGVKAMADDAAVISKLQGILKERYPQFKIDAIRPATLMRGMYEIEYQDQLAYIDPEGNQLFVGKIIDTRSKEDLTAKRWNELNVIDFKQLPFDRAIKSVRGNGDRVIAIFEDPLCPYCKQLEQSLVNVSDVTVYTLLYPLEDVHPGATEKARKIWCSDNRAEALSNWMVKNAEPQSRVCKDDPGPSLAEIAQAANRYKVFVTPTIFFADGRRVQGPMPRDELEKELDISKLN